MTTLTLLSPASTQGSRLSRFRQDGLLFIIALYWTLSANGLFFKQALDGRPTADPHTWGYGLALAGAVTALHWLLLSLVCHGRTLRPMLTLMVLSTAIASHFMQQYGVYLDPSMLRNALKTDPQEAAELMNVALLRHLILHAGPPLALIWLTPFQPQAWGARLRARALLCVTALAILLVSVYAVFQPLSSWMRNHKEARYLITPANVVWSVGRSLSREAQGASLPRESIALDAQPGPSWQAARKPRVLVLVVGETARAANWGLNGYARDTTPQLARHQVVNFASVQSCGTNTEVSVPCMFSAIGRRDYDEDRIRRQESLLHVAARAGVKVTWRDNQSGCKGVCDGLPTERPNPQDAPTLCENGRCLDEALITQLPTYLNKANGVQLLVLHQLGNHGPAYHRRYPRRFAKFLPDCQKDDLQACSPQEITNAYDNALLYTDHVLSSVIAQLKAHEASVDSALIYVSDHGESLGESGLYLHGMPYPIAPQEQTRVPMVMWLSDGWTQATGTSVACLQQRAQQPASHDHLFHTVLTMLDVHTRLQEPAWDLAGPCMARP